MKPTVWLCSAKQTWLEPAIDEKGTLSISRIAARTNLSPESVVLGSETLGVYEGLTIEELRDICGSTAGQSKEFAVVVAGIAKPAAHSEGNAVELGDVLKRLADFATKQEQRWESEKSVRISEAGTVVWDNLRNSPGFQLVPWLEEVRASHQSSIPAFTWDDRLEEAQHKYYMTHLKKYITLPGRKWIFLEVANAHPLLLSQKSFGYHFMGTTDVVVVDKKAARLPEVALKVVIELKKSNVDRKAILQTAISLVLANVVSEHFKPVAMLTDLDNTWILFWLDLLTINYHEFESRACAVGYLEDFLGDEPSLSDDSLEDRSLNDVRGGKRSGLLRRSITKRRKLTLPEIEKLDDLVGFLPDDELQRDRLEIVMKHLRQIPGVNSLLSDGEGPSELPPGIYL